MSYVTSNIRISKSLSAVIRDKIGSAEENSIQTKIMVIKENKL